MAIKNPFKKQQQMAQQETQTPEQELQEQETTLRETPESLENQANSEQADDQVFQKQLEEAKNKYLYLLSDFENFKRNAAKERVDLIQTAGRDILAALLPVLDDFERAAKNSGLPEGIALIHGKLLNTLQSKGLKPLDTKPGDDFNADVHEAVAEIPAPSVETKGKIVDVLEPGYLLGERIIRFAKVVVGK